MGEFGEVAQTMYTHVTECEKDKILKKKERNYRSKGEDSEWLGGWK
jgi:hypothetical protein